MRASICLGEGAVPLQQRGEIAVHMNFSLVFESCDVYVGISLVRELQHAFREGAIGEASTGSGYSSRSRETTAAWLSFDRRRCLDLLFFVCRTDNWASCADPAGGRRKRPPAAGGPKQPQPSFADTGPLIEPRARGRDPEQARAAARQPEEAVYAARSTTGAEHGESSARTGSPRRASRDAVRASLRSTDRARKKRNTASGSSTSAASRTAVISSPRLEEVRMSNQASTKSNVAAAVAAPSSHGDLRQAATATAMSRRASAISKPPHATSQCAERWSLGRSRRRKTTHGTSTSAAAANSTPIQSSARARTRTLNCVGTSASVRENTSFGNDTRGSSIPLRCHLSISKLSLSVAGDEVRERAIPWLSAGRLALVVVLSFGLQGDRQCR